MSMPVHRYETAEGVRWHWAEMGDGDPVVLLHGIPESWMCWKHQMPTLATQFRVLAFDLKGYGRSEKADGDYTGNGVARELLACLDKIGIDRFRRLHHLPDDVPAELREALLGRDRGGRGDRRHHHPAEHPVHRLRVPDRAADLGAVGFITPPYGLNLYVASGITGLPYFRIVRQVMPYLFSLLVVWGIVAMVPDLSTWLVKFAGLGGAGLTLN